MKVETTTLMILGMWLTALTYVFVSVSLTEDTRTYVGNMDLGRCSFQTGNTIVVGHFQNITTQAHDLKLENCCCTGSKDIGVCECPQSETVIKDFLLKE